MFFFGGGGGGCPYDSQAQAHHDSILGFRIQGFRSLRVSGFRVSVLGI